MQYLVLSMLLFCFLQASSCESPKEKPEKISLITAVKEGKLEKVKAYLHQGQSPNVSDAYGTPLLHWPSYYDKKGHMIKMLLDAGAEIDAKDIDGWIALDWAHSPSNPSAIKQLIQKAIDLNKLKIQGYDGRTLLHYAAVLDDEDGYKIVKRLLALRLDPNVKDQRDRTPLDYATRQDVKVALWLDGNR